MKKNNETLIEWLKNLDLLQKRKLAGILLGTIVAIPFAWLADEYLIPKDAPIMPGIWILVGLLGLWAAFHYDNENV